MTSAGAIWASASGITDGSGGASITVTFGMRSPEKNKRTIWPTGWRQMGQLVAPAAFLQLTQYGTWPQGTMHTSAAFTMQELQ